ncbi:MAG: hypothetical protein AAF721_12430 [Myxococcota bacterium]
MLDYKPMTRTRLSHVAALAIAGCLLPGCSADDGDPAADGTEDSTGAVDSSGSSGLVASSSEGDTGVADSTSEGGESTSGDGEESTDTGGTDDTGTTGVEVCSVVLAEIVFDPGGDDDQFQWVKLKNLCSYDIDLSTWTLGWGGPDYGDIRQKQLDDPEADPGASTVISGFGCFLVGGPQSSDANGEPVLDFPEDFAPGLNYEETIGSGVALFDMPADEVDETTVPLDAVVYGPNNDAGLIDHTGMAVAAPHVGLPPSGGSITRTGAESQWDLNVAPQAADCPNF